ncbi:multidrug resistance protein MdtN [Rosistilla carotiformis]|uniref:Multidrug resistance protein MdtN n=1 Tax=Rosistilla carotiformis TaxID=2528017 RepID=A0A518JXY6_9BACT|nr:efflux RND transporter periplasmic adaptor subunit [Rosistilla carotiformis]QDV70402.1 multidrug resistance protein MdtN [Rosistilla carotiformis]
MKAFYLLWILLPAVAIASGLPTRVVAIEPVGADKWDAFPYDRSILETRSQLHGIARGKLDSEMRFEIPGVVANVHVRDGQWVQQGEPLLSLNDAVVRAAWKVAQAQASQYGAVESARLQAELVGRQLKRLELAFREQASSEFELDEKRSQFAQAQAVLTVQQEEAKAAEANLELKAAELQKFHLIAPFAGQVVRIDKKQGQPIDPNETALMIVDARQLEIEMFLPIALFGDIVVGQTYSMRADAPVHQSLPAKAIYVAPVVDATSGTFRCVFEIENADRKLPAGFAVRLELKSDLASVRQ